ncbi:Endopolyphosphatase [Penicillium argentinense]|uniref:Endopolyphosphatase n=1 Tax=Penicillium argentinense TaxID=1131581 RepID=A0A9W9EI72_9EURO|nr:Endopolyphosphatase [Penicillium argentinense]KAJ5082254.1 Endopolyphosphatase [Penicillium argentinense]
MLSLLGLFIGAAAAVPFEQQPLAPSDGTAVIHDLAPQTPLGALSGASSQGLRGRFLHITDFHPDRYYKAGSSLEDDSCHHGKGEAGYFGQEGSQCDSPLTLVNETFRWIEENIKDDIDFVIWTGDSVRHDNDEEIPRNLDEIVEMNQYMAQKWIDLFGTRKPSHSNGVAQLSVPVVPTFGNNDILPHNIFRTGPNRWTKKFANVWNAFIPEDQRHSFVEGGWFISEVIPGKLAVISLNTMYFYESNSAVDGCKAKSEPGYEHMEWLRVQLQILRSRGMKAIIMGHVAPARSEEKTNWDETCWQKYTFWMDRYRDIVVASLYGHMNVDHFMLQDSHDADVDELSKTSGGGTVSAMSKTNYLGSLRKQWADLPTPPKGFFERLDSLTETQGKKEKKREKKMRKYLKKIGGQWAERYSVSLVSPSLVPNYFPTLRMIEYNLTGLEQVGLESVEGQTDLPSDSEVYVSPAADAQVKRKKNKKGKKKKKGPSFELPRPPSSTAPPGPAYSNQALSLLGYTQYFANLTRIDEEMQCNKNEDPRVEFEVEYTTSDEVYGLKDLTVRSFLELAIRIGQDGDISNKKKVKVNEAWRAFVERAFAGYVDVDELDEMNLVH